MEGVGARLGRTSARYGPSTTFTGPIRKWRKEWVPAAAASSTGTGSGSGSRRNNLVLFRWTPMNGGGGGQAAAEAATRRRRRYVPASDEDARDSGKNGGGTDLNLNLGLSDPDGDSEGGTEEQHEVARNPQAENRFKRKSATSDLDMRM
ncbi:hypothetical protein ACP4OV_027716 [Aristida adscensionis]